MLKIRGLRWWMIGLIMLGSIINYLTRSTLAVAAPTMLVALHITERQYSWIVGGFQIAIMAQPICGYVLDVLGLKLGFALFAAAWSLVNMAHGFAKSPYAAIALLSLAGFAHQTLSVTVITMASDLFKKNEVATAAGMAGTFGNAGLLIFSLLIGALVATIGYSPFFVCLGVLDLVGAAVLWTLVRERTVEGDAPALQPSQN